MTKHIAGLILFSFIVGVSVFVAAVTDTSTPVMVSFDSSTLEKQEYRYSKKRKKRKKRHCDNFRSKVREVRLENVSFDAGTGILDVNWASEQLGRNDQVDLHFYANDQFGARFLRTERTHVTSNAIGHKKEMKWLQSLDSDQDVFVIAASSNGWNDEVIPPSFDLSKAVSVTRTN